MPERPDTATLLRQWCVERAHFICSDDAVYEDVAAQIVQRAEGTLCNWRAQGTGPQPYRHGQTGRVRYRLRDLAAWLDSNRVNDFQ